MWSFTGFKNNKWIIGWWFLGWNNIQLGINICLEGNIEIHLPFGFLIIGRTESYSSANFVE